MDILLIRNCENAAGRFVCSLACSKFARSVGFVSCPAAEYVCVAFNAFSREVYGFGYETSKLPRGTVICSKKASGFSYFLNERPRGKSYGNPLEMAALFLMAYTYSHLFREQVKSLQAKKTTVKCPLPFLHSSQLF